MASAADVRLIYRAPVGGSKPEIAWEKSIQKGSGKQAYKVAFSAESGQSFIQIVKVPWSEARKWVGFEDLPEDNSRSASRGASGPESKLIAVFPDRLED